MRITVGDTFDYFAPVTAKLRNGAGVLVDVVDFTGWVGEAHLRYVAKSQIVPLTFAWVDAPAGLARIFAPGGTGSWPVGRLKLHVRLTAPSGATKTLPPKDIIMEAFG